MVRYKRELKLLGKLSHQSGSGFTADLEIAELLSDRQQLAREMDMPSGCR